MKNEMLVKTLRCCSSTLHLLSETLWDILVRAGAFGLSLPSLGATAAWESSNDSQEMSPHPKKHVTIWGKFQSFLCIEGNKDVSMERIAQP